MASSKKGISALQLQRSLDLKSYKRAWFMAHRIREAMDIPAEPRPLGGEGKVVEADETYVGGKEAQQARLQAQPEEHRRVGKKVVRDARSNAKAAPARSTSPT